MRNIVVLAQDLRSTHNVGSLFRTCEGMGVQKIYLCGITPYPKKNNDPRLPHIADKLTKQIEKTSLGAIDLIEWEYDSDIKSVVNMLKNSGFTIAGLEQSISSVPLHKFEAPDKIALILGNEVNGIDAETQKICDVTIEIPMQGKKESFNVIQAAAMALYRLRYN